jgi:hypothetical protein
MTVPLLGAGVLPDTTPLPVVVEFYAPGLDHYFLTADAGEQAFVDSGAVGRWLRTGSAFRSGGAQQVCRFFGNAAIDPGSGKAFGPNSHFYTAEPPSAMAEVDLQLERAELAFRIARLRDGVATRRQVRPGYRAGLSRIQQWRGPRHRQQSPDHDQPDSDRAGRWQGVDRRGRRDVRAAVETGTVHVFGEPGTDHVFRVTSNALVVAISRKPWSVPWVPCVPCLRHPAKPHRYDASLTMVASFEGQTHR